jgi:hypothetical protein
MLLGGALRHQMHALSDDALFSALLRELYATAVVLLKYVQTSRTLI